MNEMGVFETIHSSRALRRFKRDPVPDEVLAQVMRAAVCAPSAGNGQNWLFLIVKDPEQRRRLGDIFRRAGAMVVPYYARMGQPQHMSDAQFTKVLVSGLHLHEHMADAPVLLLACLRMDNLLEPMKDLPEEARAAMMNALPWMAGASIYPALQNVILACRALGLGTCMTTNHMLLEDEVKQVVKLPAGYRTFALLPIGYPVNNFGPVRRRPLAEVVAQDEFGNVPQWAQPK